MDCSFSFPQSIKLPKSKHHFKFFNFHFYLICLRVPDIKLDSGACSLYVQNHGTRNEEGIIVSRYLAYILAKIVDVNHGEDLHLLNKTMDEKIIFNYLKISIIYRNTEN